MKGWDVWGGVLTSPRAVRHYLHPDSAPAAVAGCFMSCLLRAPACRSRGAQGGGRRLHPPAGAPARGPETSLQDPGDPWHSVRMGPCLVSAVVPNPRQSVPQCGLLGLGQKRGAGRGVQPACPLPAAFVASCGRILSGAEVPQSLSAGAQLCPGKAGPRRQQEGSWGRGWCPGLGADASGREPWQHPPGCGCASGRPSPEVN